MNLYLSARMLKIGITTRITEAVKYHEERDSLAHDWGRFFSREFPDDIWVLIPNIGKNAVEYFSSLSLNVLILSGGDSLGETPLRDETELALIEYAVSKSIPILAVCRGMQLIHSFFGGKIVKGDSDFIDFHVSTEHDVIASDGIIVSLNSYHNNFIYEDTLNSSFNVFARATSDGSIEGFRRDGLLAIMWHPEREMKDKQWSTDLIKDFLENKWKEH